MKQSSAVRLSLKICLLFFACLLSGFAARANADSGVFLPQTIIKGTVFDEDGQPLPGVSVLEKGTSNGVSADFEGNFSITLKTANATLVASYIGYKTQEVPAKSDIQIHMVLEAQALEDVVMLGSRATGRVNTKSPVPVDVIDMKKVVTEVPQVNINGILNYTAPSFTSATQTVADGTDHIDPASLRGLGPDQVLVLLNGKRRHTTSLVNLNGTVGRGSVGTDLNAIPTIAIDKLEILRDGAAAQYGSDAIAGVINLGLKRNNKGTQAQINYGANLTEYQSYTEETKGDFINGAEPKYKNNFVLDGQSTQVAINHGLALGTKGFVNISGLFDWRNFTNRAGEGTGALTATGIASTSATLASDTAFLKAQGITRNDIRNRIGQSKILAGQLFVNSEYKIHEPSQSVIYAFGGISYRDGQSGANYRKPGNGNNVTAIYPKGFLPFINSDIWDGSFSAGLKGKLAKKWNYDLSNTWGRNSFDFNTSNSLNATAYDANNIAAAQKAGISIDPTKSSFDDGGFAFIQNTTNLDFSKLYSILDGLNVAVGGEMRWEKYTQYAGEVASWADYNKRSAQDFSKTDLFGIVPAGSTGKTGVGAQGFSGISSTDALAQSRTSYAAYIDLEQNFTKAFLVNLAGRYEHYTDFGHNFSWKAASRLNITKWLTLRGSVSTGFRAPSLHQRYTQKISIITNGGVASQVGTFRNDSDLAQQLGIPPLTPELSLSFAGGLAATFNKFKVTIDAYNIKISDRIIYTGTFERNSQTLPFLSAANAEKAAFFANALNTNTFGVDVVTSYNVELAAIHKLRFDLSGSYVKTEQDGDIKASDVLKTQSHLYLNPGFKSFLFTAVPRFKANFIVNYNIKKWGIFARESYIGQTEHVEVDGVKKTGDNTGSYFYKQTISGVLVTDLSASYSFNKTIRLTLGANNVFDIYPDLVNAAHGKYYRLETDPNSSNYNKLSDHGLTAKDMGIANNDALVGGCRSGRPVQLFAKGLYDWSKWSVCLH